MIFICYGMQKSASSFAWSIVKELAEVQGSKQSLIRQSYIEDRNLRVEYQNVFTTEQFDYFNDRVPQNEIMVIKSHGPVSEELNVHMQSKKGAAIATYRDPLDIVISLLDVGVAERLKLVDKQRAGFAEILSLDDAIQKLPKTVEIAESWLKSTFIKHIHYEQLCYNTSVAVDIIIRTFNDLGFQISDEQRRFVLKKFSDVNKPIIPEFNVGGVGRYFDKMNSNDIAILKNRYSDFRRKLELLNKE
jgi:hypothetical protein